MASTSYTFFAGCGGADEGMRQAGYYSVGAIEIDRYATKLYNSNHYVSATHGDVFSLYDVPKSKAWWISPPCKNFSGANNDRGQTPLDVQMGAHMSKLILEHKPEIVALENVTAYRNSDAFKMIVNALKDTGHNVEISLENAANYGAPTTRKRLIMRASMGKINPMVHSHAKLGTNPNLPRWITWRDKIKDISSEMHLQDLTAKQKAVLEKNPHRDSYVLIERCGYRGEPKMYSSNDPCPTIRSHVHHDENYSYRVAMNVVRYSDESYAVGVKTLAAWQGFSPDWNWDAVPLAHACKAIGNSVCPQLAKAVMLSFDKYGNNYATIF